MQLHKQYKKYSVSNNTLFASILNLKLVSDERLFNEFGNSLNLLLNKHKIVDVRYMGFPEKWEEILTS